MEEDDLITQIEKLDKRYKTRGNLLRFAKKDLHSYFKQALYYLGMASVVSKDSSLLGLKYITYSYRIFLQLALISSSKGGLTKYLDTHIKGGLKASINCIDDCCEGLQKSLWNIRMTNVFDIDTIEQYKDGALVLTQLFPEELKYRNLVELCYHRLLAETWIRGQAMGNPGYLNENVRYFRELCAFRGIDPKSPQN